MKQLFLNTNKFNIAILTNSIIYRLRKLPLVKHIVPGELYGNEAINAFIIVLTVFFIIAKNFISQLLYYLIIFILPAALFEYDLNTTMIITCFIFTCTYSVSNQTVLQASKDKFYGINLMRIDPNKYGVMEFTSTQLIQFIFAILSLLILDLFFHFPIYYCLLLPLFRLMAKVISLQLYLIFYKKRKIVLVYNYFYICSLYVIGLLLMGTAAFQGFKIATYVYFIIVIITTLIAIPSYLKILKTNTFKPLYKEKLTVNNVIFSIDDVMHANEKNIKKQISYDVKISNNKKGYEFFNELFVQRHRKILMNSALKFAAIFALIFLATAIILLFVPSYHMETGNLLQTRLSAFLMIMYFTNRGAKVTMAMFVNCDSKMLNYRFYRQSKTILQLFTQRLKTLLVVNLIPSCTIAFGLIVVFYICNPATPLLNYFLIFLMINAISIFFSVHNLILYYLFQPYTENLQAKGFLYNVITSITYMVCYFTINTKFNLLPFTIIVIIFCLAYIPISLFLAYQHAPKTFKLKN